MSFVTKLWQPAPNPLTPLSADAMNDLEARIAAAATQADAYNLQPSVRATNSANVSIAGTTLQSVPLDTNRFDTDSQHYTSAAALTGTVAKTSGSAALVGTGTLFTSQLSVGQVIDVPGTAVARRVVTSITDDTHLTVNANFTNTASGQTATRVNSAIVARTAGVYTIAASAIFTANGAGYRGAVLLKNGTTLIDATNAVAISAVGVPTQLSVGGMGAKLAQWDYVELQVNQSSGGALDLLAVAETSPELALSRTSAG